MVIRQKLEAKFDLFEFLYELNSKHSSRLAEYLTSKQVEYIKSFQCKNIHLVLLKLD